jgi:hypothetical protein
VTLLERFLPTYDERVAHVDLFRAPAATCYDTARGLDLLGSPVIRVLLGIRALPQALADRRADPDGAADTRRQAPTFRLDDMLGHGWTLLAEIPGEEVVFAQIGRPWKPVGAAAGPSAAPDTFAGFDEPGWAKIAFSLRVDSHGSTAAVIALETRIALTDADGRRRFARYWRAVRPFVALIDRMALRMIGVELTRWELTSSPAGPRPAPLVPPWHEAPNGGDTMNEPTQPMACPDCHALTDDLAAHEHWHSRIVHDLALAVANENKRREADAPH